MAQVTLDEVSGRFGQGHGKAFERFPHAAIPAIYGRANAYLW
jgi:hypothetical protein